MSSDCDSQSPDDMVPKPPIMRSVMTWLDKRQPWYEKVFFRTFPEFRNQTLFFFIQAWLALMSSSDMFRPLKSQKEVCGGGWLWRVVKTKNIVWLRSKSLSFEFSELDFVWLWPSWPSPDPHLTWTWPEPGPELDKNIINFFNNNIKCNNKQQQFSRS